MGELVGSTDGAVVGESLGRRVGEYDGAELGCAVSGLEGDCVVKNAVAKQHVVLQNNCMSVFPHK